jgi:N-methylhydantoinase A
MATRIGVDIGGTFTDLVVFDEEAGTARVEKVSTTPAAPEQGCVEAVRKVAVGDVLDRCDYFLHGTTVGLNALLERRGAVVGLLCTEGFRDALEIRRGSRSDNYDLFWTPPPPLVPRHLRRPVGERVLASGAVLREIDDQSVRDALVRFRERGVTSIAVCFLNSYANPVHELRAEAVLREAGFQGEISLSHRVSREYRDYERASTTAVDAFVRTRMSNYLQGVKSGITALGFAGTCLITRSGGGSMSFEDAQERSFETIMSGPVAGAEGAAELARQLGLGDLVTADVGGTSFDTSLIIGGRPQLLYQGEIDGTPIQAPWVDVRSIGAGGGSIARLDLGGLLQVGPQSSGAVPGPACYGRGGTEPTVTDAAFFLGMLGSGRLASDVCLRRDRAEAALEKVGRALGVSTRETAIGIIRIACSNMANAIREITIERGVDPRELKLLPFGGAGPMLATQMARELSIDAIIVPPFAGNFSAWGLLGSDLVRSASRTQRMALSEGDLRALDGLAQEMFGELERRGDGGAFLDAARELALDMRFVGQEHGLTVPVALEAGRRAQSGESLEAAFRDAYERNFSLTLGGPVEIIGVRAALRKPLARSSGHIIAQSLERRVPDPGEAHVLYSFALEREVAARALQRSSLSPGESHAGPAVIYEETATTYVDADFSYTLDAQGCLRLNREEP